MTGAVSVHVERGLRLLLVLSLVVGSSAAAADGYDGYLSGGEVAAIGAGSAAILGLSEIVGKVDSDHTPWIEGPLPGDRAALRFFGGEYHAGKTNFLDNTVGSAFTPVLGGVALTVANTAWPRDGEFKDVSQDLFIYVTGLAATKGVTSIVKGTVGRPRPHVYLYPALAKEREESSYSYDHQSFFSGHASSAFFSMAFLNKRVRETLRRESPESYSEYNWVSSTLCFGWATYVGWTRLHAYKHYLSDVAVGAAAGWLLAELFYSFDEVRRESVAGSAGAGGFYFSWGFRF